MILKIVQNLIRILLKYNILAFENSLCPSVKTNKTSKKDDGFFWIRCINVFIQMHVKYHPIYFNKRNFVIQSITESPEFYQPE